MTAKLGLDDEGTEPDWLVWNFTYVQVYKRFSQGIGMTGAARACKDMSHPGPLAGWPAWLARAEIWAIQGRYTATYLGR